MNWRWRAIVILTVGGTLAAALLMGIVETILIRVQFPYTETNVLLTHGLLSVLWMAIWSLVPLGVATAYLLWLDSKGGYFLPSAIATAALLGAFAFGIALLAPRFLRVPVPNPLVAAPIGALVGVMIRMAWLIFEQRLVPADDSEEKAAAFD